MKIVEGNIVEAEESYIMHGCNCQGVMGSGVARAIRDRWVDAYVAYRNDYLIYEQGGNQHKMLGNYCSFQCDDKEIFNLYTQDKYGRDGKAYASAPAIFSSLIRATRSLSTDRSKNVHEIAIPKIGCGLGGLVWENHIEKVLLDVEFITGNCMFVIYDLGYNKY